MEIILLLLTQLGEKLRFRFLSRCNSQVLYNTVTDSQSEGVNEPILLQRADAAPTTMVTATYSGNVENTLFLSDSQIEWVLKARLTTL